MCDNNLYPDGHHSLIQRPLCPNPGCSLITEHLSPPSPIGEPGTLVGPVCLVGGGGAVQGRDLKAQVLLRGRESALCAP